MDLPKRNVDQARLNKLNKDTKSLVFANRPFIELINRGSMEEEGDRKIARQNSAQFFSQALYQTTNPTLHTFQEEQQAHQSRAILHQSIHT